MAVSVFFSMEAGKDVLTRLKRCTVSFKKSTDKFRKMYCLVGKDILTRLDPFQPSQRLPAGYLMRRYVL